MSSCATWDSQMYDDDVLDTNVFIHAALNDNFGGESRALLRALACGELSAHLHPLVVHELTYVLPRTLRQMTRTDIATYILNVLSWPGISGDVALLADAVGRWQRTPGLGFVAAYLSALAAVSGKQVFAKNVSEFRAQGVYVPVPLPAGTGNGHA